MLPDLSRQQPLLLSSFCALRSACKASHSPNTFPSPGMTRLLSLRKTSSQPWWVKKRSHAGRLRSASGHLKNMIPPNIRLFVSPAGVLCFGVLADIHLGTCVGLVLAGKRVLLQTSSGKSYCTDRTKRDGTSYVHSATWDGNSYAPI